MADNLELVCEAYHGVHIPQIMARRLEDHGWTGIGAADVDICETGPEADCYWDAWSDILENAQYTDDQGEVWRLWQDGDLWAYKVSAAEAGELAEFFGE